MRKLYELGLAFFENLVSHDDEKRDVELAKWDHLKLIQDVREIGLTLI